MVEVRDQSDYATSKWENHLLRCARGNRHIRKGTHFPKMADLEHGAPINQCPWSTHKSTVCLSLALFWPRSQACVIGTPDMDHNCLLHSGWVHRWARPILLCGERIFPEPLPQSWNVIHIILEHQVELRGLAKPAPEVQNKTCVHILLAI